MTEIWAQAALWLGLALVASLLSIWLRIATALMLRVGGALMKRRAGRRLPASGRWITGGAPHE
ncbi:hypothetical protein [Accumulibacter sp.]|uniref:hypothetical protein n=1 Tax=Accumulibacter sp. TaxID=2053492 RepID=UPI0035B1A3A7